MAIKVRRASGNDAALVALLGRLTFRETFGHLFTGFEDDLYTYLEQTFSVPKIESSIAKHHNRYWLLESDALPIGYAKLKHPSPHQLVGNTDAVQLQKIYILSDFHNLGAGKILIDAVTAEACTLRATSMWLTALAANERATRFYQRNGWQVAGETTFAIGAQEFPFFVFENLAFKGGVVNMAQSRPSPDTAALPNRQGS